MLSKPYLIGAAGVLVLAVAGTLFYFTTEEGGLPAAVDTATQQSAGTGEAGNSAPSTASSAPKQPAPAANAKKDANKPDLSQPSFDVVRVDPEGNTVIAGKALPNATVRIMDGERQIGEVQADDKGDWVFVPEEKLPAGNSVLTLESESKDGSGTPTKSDNAVVVVIPEKGKDIAGQPSSAAEKPLAMVVPRDKASSAPTKILQAPAAPTGEAPKTGSEVASAETPKATAQSFPEKSQEAGSPADVSLDVIDYDSDGAVVFSGTSTPDTEVQIYVDNKLAARTKTDDKGKWSVKPEGKIEAGTHKIRVDKVSSSGQVLARVELPFVRATPFTGLPEDAVVVIQPGNNLWRIASRVYGSGFRYTEIYQANSDQIRDPDLIYPGQVFGLPAVN